VRKPFLPAVTLVCLLAAGSAVPAMAQVDIAGILETGTATTQIDSVAWYVAGSPVTQPTPDWGGQSQMTDTFQFSQLTQRSDYLIVMYHVDTIQKAHTLPGPEWDVWYDLPEGSRVMFLDTVLRGISEGHNVPAPARLSAAPDPFRTATRIRWDLPSRNTVEVSAFDGSGRCVFSRTAGSAGLRSFVWDGRDATGQRLPAGVYFVNVRSGAEQAIVPVTIIR
jgi:hypothetical protein